ncbi:MAG: class I SAM-dependent methyltransferase [Pseudomonadota bacterium]
MQHKLNTLFDYCFEKGYLDFPIPESKILLLNCLRPSSLKREGHIEALTYHKNLSDILEKDKITITQKLNNEFHDFIFCILPKNKIEAQFFISLCAQSVSKNGKIIIVAANDAGGKSLKKWLDQSGFEGDFYSKSKARLFVGSVKDKTNQTLQSYADKGLPLSVELESQSYVTQPGIFGWNKIDQGSKLLIESMNLHLKGAGADFGCGYGYLSKAILDRENTIRKLYLCDVDQRAVHCAVENLKDTSVEVVPCWVDLTKDKPFREKLDWIIMNPPFHAGKHEDKNLGQKMIEAAHQALKNRGSLYMVANRHLPYEETLSVFSEVEKINEERGFKVFKAVK